MNKQSTEPRRRHFRDAPLPEFREEIESEELGALFEQDSVQLLINTSTKKFLRLFRGIARCCNHRPARSLRLLVTARLPGGIIARGINMELKNISLENELPFTIEAVTIGGNDARIDGEPSFAFDNEGTTEVIADPAFEAGPDPDGKYHYIARPVEGAHPGVATKITATVDADLGEGVRSVSVDIVTITWTQPEADHIEVELGTERPRT